jgi:hypothetical protein
LLGVASALERGPELEQVGFQPLPFQQVALEEGVHYPAKL